MPRKHQTRQNKKKPSKEILRRRRKHPRRDRATRIPKSGLLHGRGRLVKRQKIRIAINRKWQNKYNIQDPNYTPPTRITMTSKPGKRRMRVGKIDKGG